MPEIYRCHQQSWWIYRIVLHTYVYALIADLLAIQKVAGFLAPAKSHYFCSYCLCPLEDLEKTLCQQILATQIRFRQRL
jgi:hypothetical protein